MKYIILQTLLTLENKKIVINFQDFINNNILWIVPIITIFIGIIFRIFECYQNNIDFHKVFDFGLDLIVSTIILLITNYKSETTVWLILFFFISCIIVLIIRQRNFNSVTNHINIRGILITIAIGLLMLVISIAHISGLTIGNVSFFWESIIF